MSKAVSDLDELDRRVRQVSMNGFLREDLRSVIEELKRLRKSAAAAAFGEVFLDVIEMATEQGITEDSPRDDVVNAYIAQWQKNRARIMELESDVERLRKVIEVKERDLQAVYRSGTF